jgi:hypothetical protein
MIWYRQQSFRLLRFPFPSRPRRSTRGVSGFLSAPNGLRRRPSRMQRCPESWSRQDALWSQSRRRSSRARAYDAVGRLFVYSLPKVMHGIVFYGILKVLCALAIDNEETKTGEADSTTAVTPPCKECLALPFRKLQRSSPLVSGHLARLQGHRHMGRVAISPTTFRRYPISQLAAEDNSPEHGEAW